MALAFESHGTLQVNIHSEFTLEGVLASWYISIESLPQKDL